MSLTISRSYADHGDEPASDPPHRLGLAPLQRFGLFDVLEQMLGVEAFENAPHLGRFAPLSSGRSR